MARFGRIALDQWFTPDEWAQACVDDLLAELPELNGREFLEPSAGGGAFIRALEARGQRVSGYDLEPQAEGITEADFLLDEVDCEGAIVIGNPPYGRAHSLSRAFVKRAFEQGATYVAFLLPLGFMRDSIHKVGRRIEYFKDMAGMGFIGVAGALLPAPVDRMAWIVLSADPIQESTSFFEAVHFSEADSWWLQGIEYGSECEPKIYHQADGIGRFTGVKSDGRRVTGTSYRKLQEPTDSSLLKHVAIWSGNSIQPGVRAANFLLSFPELYRGELRL